MSSTGYLCLNGSSSKWYPLLLTVSVALVQTISRTSDRWQLRLLAGLISVQQNTAICLCHEKGLSLVDGAFMLLLQFHLSAIPYTFRTENPAVRGVTCLPCTTSEQHLRWLFLHCRRPAHMERASVQPMRHWAITDYFQRTSENIGLLILRRVLRPRHICDIYDLFVLCINLLTYLLTYLTSRTFQSQNYAQWRYSRVTLVITLTADSFTVERKTALTFEQPWTSRSDILNYQI